jgi:hypothetical protein
MRRSRPGGFVRTVRGSRSNCDLGRGKRDGFPASMGCWVAATGRRSRAEGATLEERGKPSKSPSSRDEEKYRDSDEKEAPDEGWLLINER